MQIFAKNHFSVIYHTVSNKKKEERQGPLWESLYPLQHLSW